MNKFEQLIEFVINDDEKRAKALFHEIVVEKSKDIYEEIMSEEEITEKKQGYKDREDEHLGAKDGAESGKKQSMKDRRDDEMGKRGKRDAEHDNKQKIDDDVNESEIGGSQVDSLIDEVEAEEQGVRMEDDEEEIEMIDIDVDDDDGEEELEDRVVDIEDKLDELMGEFEELMGQVDDNTDDIDGEQDEIDDIDSDTDMEQDEIDGMQDQMDEPIDVNVEVEGFNENVDLVPAPKPVTTSPASKSPVAANSGQKGMDAHPVNFDDGNKGKEGRPTPKYVSQDNTTKPDVKPATKPDLAQASGVNTKSVID